MSEVTTAAALAAFRDELAALGFTGDTIDRLVVAACDAEVRSTDGLTIGTVNQPAREVPNEPQHPEQDDE